MHKNKDFDGMQMSQADVMEFLDSRPGEKFTCKELCDVFKDKLAIANIYRALGNIIKRKEYCANIITLHGKPTALYWRKKK